MDNDTISRQAAIDAMQCVTDSICAQQAIDALSTLPSAERRGRWVDLKCDQCGQVDMSKPNYCPNCGARMGGEEK